MQHKLSSLLLPALAALVVSCGGSNPPPPSSPSRVHVERSSAAPSSGAMPQGGSSDGVTCEAARDQNVEEVTIGASSAPDLSAKDLGAVLNNGQYLDACGVANGAKVSVCAAVKQGAVVGVTIAMDPADPELEKCVAAEVRKLTFPAHPKMDIVKTQF